MMVEVLAAFTGTIAFSLTFGVPKQYYPYCGTIGAVGWMCYRLILDVLNATEATFVATIVVIFLSRLFAVRKRCPVTIFLISGIFSLVPGAGIYWTAYYLVTNNIDMAADTGFTALKSAVAIVLGIVFVFELPQKLFRIGIKD